ncbi:MAG TPA: efflux RND transporter permease subunit, partial [Candidatus Cloacimonadota bacterium]|nr:efflux RND transporter permease subunit [Candidatus Cloacimonadota bacterium]
IPLTTLTGQHVTLSAVATITEENNPLEVKHETQQRVVSVKADLNKISLGKAVKNVKNLLSQQSFSPDVVVEIGGQITEQAESFNSLYLLFILGIVLVYMVMAAQFESFLDPFVILFAVPLALIGVVWAFIVAQVTLSVVSFLGIIMLLGIVVNNGIVLVTYTNLLRARGMDMYKAVIEAGHSRLRPVLMTALTTIFGMLPMAFSKGLGSEIWKPLGITVIGGLIVSTLITLILIPILYLSFHKYRKLEKGA